MAVCVLAACDDVCQPREVTWLEDGWLFAKADSSTFATEDFDASGWQPVRVPHDWAISGPFDMSIDRQGVKVIEDGDSKISQKTGRTGALPYIGIGWYRYDLGALPLEGGREYRLEFDGAMSNASVFINGKFVGNRPYGYSSFAFDITGYLNNGDHNLLAVRLENLPESSRWYPGAGLYRNVRLVSLSPVHVAHWGTNITTPMIGERNATILARIEVENRLLYEGVILKTVILDPKGRKVASAVDTLSSETSQTSIQEFNVCRYRKWDIDSPQLYTMVNTLVVNGQTVDEYSTSFGIRTFSFDPDRGFSLNGKPMKIHGVCLHHDLGPLGAAVNERAIERQLEMMKEMGCNAIRTSHNPAAPELLDLCDRMGLLVIEESFDEWRIPKNRNGYSLYFDEWSERDLADMVRRDRNHPSIIAWSIGNEIREQGVPEGAETARFLTDICHREDPTRPVTAALNNAVNALNNGFGEVLDIVGLNYKSKLYPHLHEQYPSYCLVGTETVSTVSSRGKYYSPLRPNGTLNHDDFHCNAYDIDFPSWASTPDTEFAAQYDNPFVAGEFVWTGFDYLGEPTPYNETGTSRSSYFGIVDLAGIRKDRYYLYQSQWSEKPVLRLLPYWNWNDGDRVPVLCYTNYPEVELFLNGRSLGRKTKDKDRTLGRYRMIWDNVVYEPGELRAVAYGKNGRVCEECVTYTSGQPCRLELHADRARIKADGKDLSFVEIAVTDRNGNVCPDAALPLKLTVDGGRLVALCNGDQTSLESFTAGTMHTFSGKCMAVISSGTEAGRIRVQAVAPDNIDGFVEIKSYE